MNCLSGAACTHTSASATPQPGAAQRAPAPTSPPTRPAASHRRAAPHPADLQVNGAINILNYLLRYLRNEAIPAAFRRPGKAQTQEVLEYEAAEAALQDDLPEEHDLEPDPAPAPDVPEDVLEFTGRN